MTLPLSPTVTAIARHLQRLAQAEQHVHANQHRLLGPLMSRLRASVQAHREYTTIRHESAVWVPLAPGIQIQRLRHDGLFSVQLWKLDALAALPWPLGALGMEILVVSGKLGTNPRNALQESGGHAYCVVNDAAQLAQCMAVESTVLYVRQRLVPMQALPALEAHWWELAAATDAPQWNTHRSWMASSTGVEVQVLAGDTQVVSMLVRFAAGASVADHHHALDEDCLVLQGEVFLGDILLRAGDYQLAPAGGSHFGETSDVGVTLYFHGALDPVLLSAGAGHVQRLQ